MIFEDYCRRGMGLGEIADKLNSNLDRYPPPLANRKDEMALRKTWSRSQIQAMLRNPKYTGYNVWGRHDKHPGRPLIRPREQWVWSATPTHPALISKELFEQVEERVRGKAIASRQAPASYPRRRTRRPGRLYVLRGRVRCAMCGRRMEGTHQRKANYYRCRFDANRGRAAAEATGHPRALQIKEDLVLDALLDFMGRRIFGPERLRCLRHELAAAASGNDDRRSIEFERLRAELKEVDQALYRQALRMEEHDDPDHPVVALAKERISELTARRPAIENAILVAEATRPDTATPAEIEAMLDSVPDLRPALTTATPDELAEIVDAFDITVAYDKPNRTLALSASVTPDTAEALNANRPPHGRSGISSIAGERFVLIGDLSVAVERTVPGWPGPWHQALNDPRMTERDPATDDVRHA